MKKMTKIFLLVIAAAAIGCLVKACAGGQVGKGDTEKSTEAPAESTEAMDDKEDTDVIDSEFIDPETGYIDMEKYYEEFDIDAYYRERGKVVAVYGVKESTRTQTEKEAEEFLYERGFDQTEITFDYSMDAEFLDDQEVTGSDTKHPAYQTYYLSSSTELWTVCLSNGYITAYPVSYEAAADRGVSVIISESEIFPGYNEKDNTFYEIIPYESKIMMVVVDRIDAETLDSLTVEALEEL